MLLLSIGDIPHLSEVASSVGVRTFFISGSIDAKFPLPVLRSHEEYEEYALDNKEEIVKIVGSLQEKPTCVVWPNYESGIFLVLLEELTKKFGKVDVLLFTQNFAATHEKKILSRILLGVLSQFLNVGIDYLFWFSFDIMRKIYKDLKIINQKEWIKKSFSLFYSQSVFVSEKPEVELSGETIWSVLELDEIKKMGKMVVLSEYPLTDELLKDFGLYIYKVVYYISNCEAFDEEELVKEVEKKTEVLREYLMYNFGSSDLLAYFVALTKLSS